LRILPLINILLTQAAASIDNPSNLGSATVDNETLFIHWEYHPHGIQRSDIRRLYGTTLKPSLPYKNMTIAISRPPNLKDILTRARLNTPPNTCIESLITECTNT
jgi:hypothetical protein